jgi:hypothetical protein
MKLSLKIILLTIFIFSFVQQSYGQSLKYKAESLLDLTAIEYKALAANGNYDLVGVKVAVSPLILGAAIWNSKEELIFPRQDHWKPISQNMVLNDLHRMAPLLELAKLTAWEKRTADGSSLLYCRKDTMSLCFLVDTEELAQHFNQEKQYILENVLIKQSQSIQTLPLFVLFIIAGLLVWFSWQYFLKGRKEINNQPGVSNADCSDSLKIAELILNPSKLTIQKGDKIIHIGDKDMKLLMLFAKRPNEVISKEELYITAWQRPFLSTSRALDQHMMVLRRKVNTDLSNANIIDNVHGHGYRYNFVEN